MYYILNDTSNWILKAWILNSQSGAVTGISLSFSGWALEKRGPVLVSMFSPVGTVCSIIFSIVTQGDSTVNIGRYFHKIHRFFLLIVYFPNYYSIIHDNYIFALQHSGYVPHVHRALLCALGQRERRWLREWVWCREASLKLIGFQLYKNI